MTRRSTRRTCVPYAAAACLALVLTLVSTGATPPPGERAARAAAAAAPMAVGTSTHRLAYGLTTRSFRVYRPAALSGPVPLVLVLHAAFGTTKQAQSDYGWDAKASAEGFLVAYPDGLYNTWNTRGGCCGTAAALQVDDLRFLRDVVTSVSASLAGGPVTIDPRRRFATGLSNGAMMSYTLACDAPGLVAAIAPVAGNQTVSCSTGAPTSVLVVHGLDDPNVPYDGSPGSGGFDGPPVEDVVAQWRARDLCETPVLTGTGPVTRSVATCAAGRGVDVVTIAGGGHGWPGAVNRPTTNALLGLDAPSTAINATDEVWSFFAAHPAP